MKKRKPFYKPTDADWRAAAARHIAKRRGITFEEAKRWLDDAAEYQAALERGQAALERLNGAGEADPYPRQGARVIAFPARRRA